MKTLLAKIIVPFLSRPTDPEILDALYYKRHHRTRDHLWYDCNQKAIKAYEKHKDNIFVLAAREKGR